MVTPPAFDATFWYVQKCQRCRSADGIDESLVQTGHEGNGAAGYTGHNFRGAHEHTYHHDFQHALPFATEQRHKLHFFQHALFYVIFVFTNHHQILRPGFTHGHQHSTSDRQLFD